MANKSSRKNGQEIIELQAVNSSYSERRQGDPRNILGVIIDKNENNLYTIATVVTGSCLISTLESSSLPSSLPSTVLLKEDSDINGDKHVSLREALKCTASGGQGFVKCNCASIRTKAH